MDLLPVFGVLSRLPPKIVQWDNEREFEGALLKVLYKMAIAIINRRHRSPQTRDLVDQDNKI